jgi:hypothetical protein
VRWREGLQRAALPAVFDLQIPQNMQNLSLKAQ